MAGWRRAVDLAMTAEEIETLTALSRSRTEAARHVERAQMLLAYRQQRSFFAVGQRLGVHHQTVQRCVERALAYGALAALDDRPRPGKEPTITSEAKAWLVSLACDKAKEHGYPHELWTTRLLARHARERGPAAGHECLAHLVQGTVCKILGQEDIYLAFGSGFVMTCDRPNPLSLATPPQALRLGDARATSLALRTCRLATMEAATRLARL